MIKRDIFWGFLDKIDQIPQFPQKHHCMYNIQFIQQNAATFKD
jgi:hypothetical protein